MNSARLGDLVDSLIRMAALDFSQPAPVGEAGDDLDALAVGLNMLAEELQGSVVSRGELERANAQLRAALADVEALTGAERLGRAMVDALPTSACVLGPQGRIVSVNAAWRAYAEANGASPEWVEPLGLDYAAFCEGVTGAEAEESAAFAVGIREVLRAERRYEQVYACPTPQGPTWYRARVSRFGEPTHVLIEHQDITESKLLELRLLRSQRQAQVGNWELNLCTKRLWCSEEVSRILGLSLGATDTFEELLIAVHPEDRARVESAMRRAFAEGSPCKETFRTRPVDHVVRHVESRCEFDFARDGSPQVARGTLQDVTQRVNAARALRSHEARLRLALEASAQGVFEVDVPTRTVHFDSGCARGLGYAPEAFSCFDHRGFLELVHPGERSFVARILEDLLSGARDDLRSEVRLLAADGDFRWIRVSACVTERSDTGEPLRLLGTHASCQEQKEREEALARALREKEALLREVHHRVKNNLQVVTSLLHLHAVRASTGEARRAFEDSRDRVRAMALVHDFLHGGDPTQVDLGGYLKRLVEGLRSSHGGQAQVRCDTSGVSPLELDLDRVIPAGLLVNELVSNAFKHAFADRSPGTIEVTARRVGGTVELSVADDGVGLPPRALAEKSTGFGLELVRNLVDQLGASFKADDGPGTRLRVTIPLSASARGPAHPEGTP